MDRAEALVREMEEEGIDAPIDIYHTMMDGYTMVGNENKCIVVFERLKVCFLCSSLCLVSPGLISQILSPIAEQGTLFSTL